MARQLSETLAVIGAIDPADHGTTTEVSDYADMSKYGSALIVINAGAITSTIVATVKQATDSSGTGAKNLTSSKAVSIADTDDNKQWVIGVDINEMDIANSFYFLAISIAFTGGSTNLMSAVIAGSPARYSPVASHDITSVDEIVS